MNTKKINPAAMHEHTTATHQHTMSPRMYYTIYASLLGLLALTVLTAYIDLGAWSIVLALMIAALKAVLVVLYFMHVRFANRLTWIFVGGGFVWLLIMLILTMSDYVSRGWIGEIR